MNRRHFLLATLIAAFATRSWAREEIHTMPDWLAQLTLDPVAASALGKAYLADHPEENDPDYLLKALERATGRKGTFASLDRTVRAEYARDDCVPVNNWILSRTEARLYALIAVRGQLH